MISAVIFDLDGTLFDCAWRLQKFSYSFNEFNKNHIYDKVKQPILEILKSMKDKYEIIFISGRSEKFRETTEKQLNKYIDKICVFEMVNPKPVPLMYGIKDVDDFVDDSNVDIKSLESMLAETEPDVFHIHTLMGLPLEYLKIIKKRGIRTVYTSHDYFGLCARVNFIDNQGCLCSQASAKRCYICNSNAKSTLFLRGRNSKCLVPLKQILRKVAK